MITVNGSRIVFTDQLRPSSVDTFLACVAQCVSSGPRRLVFDFSAVSSAWPDSMVPVIATTDGLRMNGHSVVVELPKEPTLRGLFIEMGWAHCLDPQHHEHSSTDHENFQVRRFASASEQQAVVNEFMKLVLGKLEPSKEVLTAIEWSINEITDNVLTHSQSKIGGIVQVHSVPDLGGIVFCVADCGRGILASLREGYPNISSDESAISEAIKRGLHVTHVLVKEMASMVHCA